jgi:hypothetical protein
MFTLPVEKTLRLGLYYDFLSYAVTGGCFGYKGIRGAPSLFSLEFTFVRYSDISGDVI